MSRSPIRGIVFLESREVSSRNQVASLEYEIVLLKILTLLTKNWSSSKKALTKELNYGCDNQRKSYQNSVNKSS